MVMPCARHVLGGGVGVGVAKKRENQKRESVIHGWMDAMDVMVGSSSFFFPLLVICTVCSMYFICVGGKQKYMTVGLAFWFALHFSCMEYVLGDGLLTGKALACLFAYLLARDPVKNCVRWYGARACSKVIPTCVCKTMGVFHTPP